MLLEFATPVDGCDAFETEGAPREDLILICAALTRTVNQLGAEKRKLADALSPPPPPDDVPLAEKLGAVITLTGAERRRRSRRLPSRSQPPWPPTIMRR